MVHKYGSEDATCASHNGISEVLTGTQTLHPALLILDHQIVSQVKDLYLSREVHMYVLARHRLCPSVFSSDTVRRSDALPLPKHNRESCTKPVWWVKSMTMIRKTVHHYKICPPTYLHKLFTFEAHLFLLAWLTLWPYRRDYALP